ALADWWNSITLRSKITGVTVIVLTFGLLVTGAGTVIILKQALIEQAKAELVALAAGDISRYIDVDDEGERHVRETTESCIAAQTVSSSSRARCAGRTASSPPT